MIYLASPYSHEDEHVEQRRYRAALRAAVRLMRESGEAVFSPIAHSHPMKVESKGAIGGDWRTWAEFDRAVIGACSSLAVLRLPGWRDSRGVAAEIEIAQGLGLAVFYIIPDEDELLAAGPDTGRAIMSGRADPDLIDEVIGDMPTLTADALAQIVARSAAPQPAQSLTRAEVRDRLLNPS